MHDKAAPPPDALLAIFKSIKCSMIGSSKLISDMAS